MSESKHTTPSEWEAAMRDDPWPVPYARLSASVHAALNYVADMTYCGADGEWRFKPGYDPQVVLDAIAKAGGKS